LLEGVPSTLSRYILSNSKEERLARFYAYHGARGYALQLRDLESARKMELEYDRVA